MDINTLRGLGTVFAFVAFVGVVIWAYSASKKKDFDEAAQLPFADEEDDKASGEQHKDARRDK